MTTAKTLADGCFDPLHIGHVEYLRAAAALGYPVTVRVAPDADVEKKGRHPFQSELERGAFLKLLRCVEDVCYFDTLEEAIRAIRPRYLVKGMCWHNKLSPEIQVACEAMGTSIVYTLTPSRSSTERLSGVV